MVEASVIQEVKNAYRIYLAKIKVCIELFSVHFVIFYFFVCAFFISTNFLFCLVHTSSTLTFPPPIEFFRPFFLPLDVDVLSMWHLSNERKNLNMHSLRFHRATAKNLEV